jgi:ubiquitin carboxyl-terminal hydrolase 36/42
MMKGLPNFGNTCYLNSIIQILVNTPQFIECLRSFPLKIASPPEGEGSLQVSTSFYHLLNAYHSQSNNADELRSALSGFIANFIKYHDSFGSGQQDQHEYLMLLFRIIHDTINIPCSFNITGELKTDLDKLEQKSLLSYRIDGMSTNDDNLTGTDSKAYDSAIFRLFTGQFHFRTECRNCHYVSHRFETFRSWEVPTGNPTKDSLTLEDSLDEYTGVTQLADDDKYECDSCKVKTQSLRKCSIWRLPEILIINIKRNIIHQIDRRFIALKDPREVEAPVILDCEPYMSVPRGKSKYELYATANHFGSPTHGHCMSFIKTDGGWNYLDDERIGGTANIDNSSQYILFYRRI